MSELPERPDAEQLRRQAKELLRAAKAGDPEAIARLRAISAPLTLAGAQLVLARSYGAPSWPVLLAEAERRRALHQPRSPAPRALGPVAPPATRAVWSFTGGDALELAEGRLLARALLVAPTRALVEASLYGTQPSRRPRMTLLGGRLSLARPRSRRAWQRPRLDDLVVVDDRGERYRTQLATAAPVRGSEAQPGTVAELRLLVEPCPAAEVVWIELRGRDGATCRLVRSAVATTRATQRMTIAPSPDEQELQRLAASLLRRILRLRGAPGRELVKRAESALARVEVLSSAGGLDGDGPVLAAQLAELAAVITAGGRTSGLPSSWASMVTASKSSDGPPLGVDVGVELPALDGISLRLDALVSRSRSWSLHFAATPGWLRYDDRGSPFPPLSIKATDDVGGSYLDTDGPKRGQLGPDEVELVFRPRLDPRAGRLRLLVRGPIEELVVEIDLRR